MTADVAEREIVQHTTSDDPGDSAHIVFVPGHLRGDVTPQALVLQARVEGIEIEALCGYRWVPRRDPEPLPVCAKCLDIYQHNGRDLDQRDRLPDA